MIQNIRVGIPIIGGEWWMGGVSYIELLIHAVTSLPKNDRPELFLVVYDHNLDDFLLHEELVPLLNGIIYVGANRPAAENKIGDDFIHYSSQNDLFSFIDFYFPVNTDVIPRKNAGTWIPDFQHFYLPEFFTQKDLDWRNAQFIKIVEHSHLIVFSSEAAKKDFQKFFPDSSAVTKVLHFHTLPQKSWYEPDPHEIRKKYGIPERFIICCNQFWVHKNHKRLLEAFSLIRQIDPEVALVCTGSTKDYRSADYFSELQDYIREQGISNLVYVLGMIPRSEQIQLIRGSLFVIQPSLFEGWSTVVEDCRALGKIILLSDLDVNIEQAPEYGEYFNGTDINDLAEKMVKIIKTSEIGPDLSRETIARHNAKHYVETYAKQFCEIVHISQSVKSNYIEKWLHESEKIIEIRDESINSLEGMLAESEADRQARLEVIGSLQGQLEESETDRQERLKVINGLQDQLAESEADRQARLEVINELLVELTEKGLELQECKDNNNELTTSLNQHEINISKKLWLIKKLIKLK